MPKRPYETPETINLPCPTFISSGIGIVGPLVFVVARRSASGGRRSNLSFGLLLASGIFMNVKDYLSVLALKKLSSPVEGEDKKR
jgi:threonine/homoserine/homoserine lactone efflux protein